jgi:hypothetical protein
MVWFRENWYEEVSRQLRQGLAKCLAIAFENRGAVSEATITPHTLNFVKKLVSTFGIGIGRNVWHFNCCLSVPGQFIILLASDYSDINLHVEPYKTNCQHIWFCMDFVSGSFSVHPLSLILLCCLCLSFIFLFSYSFLLFVSFIFPFFTFFFLFVSSFLSVFLCYMVIYPHA